MACPVLAFQILAVPSALAVETWMLSGLKDA